jgi:hypothetical protein
MSYLSCERRFASRKRDLGYAGPGAQKRLAKSRLYRAERELNKACVAAAIAQTHQGHSEDLDDMYQLELELEYAS